MPVIPAHGKPRKEDLEFETSLGNIAGPPSQRRKETKSDRCIS
jgi:hypothetical protein